jgi:hypothetical protein
MIIDATQSDKPADQLVQQALHKHEQENHARVKQDKPQSPIPLPEINVILPKSAEDDEMIPQRLVRLGVKAENITYKG